MDNKKSSHIFCKRVMSFIVNRLAELLGSMLVIGGFFCLIYFNSWSTRSAAFAILLAFIYVILKILTWLSPEE